MELRVHLLDLHSEKDSLWYKKNCCLAHKSAVAKAHFAHFFLGNRRGYSSRSSCTGLHSDYILATQANANFSRMLEATLFAGHQSLKGARGGGTNYSTTVVSEVWELNSSSWDILSRHTTEKIPRIAEAETLFCD